MKGKWKQRQGISVTEMESERTRGGEKCWDTRDGGREGGKGKGGEGIVFGEEGIKKGEGKEGRETRCPACGGKGIRENWR